MSDITGISAPLIIANEWTRPFSDPASSYFSAVAGFTYTFDRGIAE